MELTDSYLSHYHAFGCDRCTKPSTILQSCTFSPYPVRGEVSPSHSFTYMWYCRSSTVTVCCRQLASHKCSIAKLNEVDRREDGSNSGRFVTFGMDRFRSDILYLQAVLRSKKKLRQQDTDFDEDGHDVVSILIHATYKSSYGTMHRPFRPTHSILYRHYHHLSDHSECCFQEPDGFALDEHSTILPPTVLEHSTHPNH